MIKNDCYRDFFPFSRAHLFCALLHALSTFDFHHALHFTANENNISQILKSKRLRKISPLLAKDERRKNGHWDYRR